MTEFFSKYNKNNFKKARNSSPLNIIDGKIFYHEPLLQEFCIFLKKTTPTE